MEMVIGIAVKLEEVTKTIESMKQPSISFIQFLKN